MAKYLNAHMKDARILKYVQYGNFLIFDNHPFKLAVIQQLMYEYWLLGDKYSDGDRFFRELNIPYFLADKVTELYSGEEFDYITRSIRRFPNLKKLHSICTTLLLRN